MTKFSASLMFGLLYLLYYIMPLAAIITILKFFNINLQYNIGPYLGILAILTVGFRTKFAAEIYCNNFSFKDAHNQSWIDMKVYLSFLPILGNFFNK